MGLRVPEDVEIAGFEGFRDSGFDHLVSTPLTVNEHPTREMAIAVVDLLLEEIRACRQGKKAVFQKVVLKTRLAQANASALRTGAQESDVKHQHTTGGIRS
jgi:DNA-binding LacI/PurR family transcriptional regulator